MANIPQASAGLQALNVSSQTRPHHRGSEIVTSDPLPRSSYRGPRPSRHSLRSDSDQPKTPCLELRSFFSGRARRLADEIEQGLPVEPRELMLLVQAAREIITLEAA